jgi:hypothetical protein
MVDENIEETELREELFYPNLVYETALNAYLMIYKPRPNLLWQLQLCARRYATDEPHLPAISALSSVLYT